MLKQEDKKFILDRGSDVSIVETQIQNFKTDFPFLPIEKAAEIGDGIIQLTKEEIISFGSSYLAKASEKKVLKFVPASGAATRMFKELFAYLENEDFEGNEAVKKFMSGLKSFAFYSELANKLGDQINDPKQAVSALLHDMEYGTLPKALLSFHRYDDQARTPLEEHLVEGAKYAESANREVNIHFTVSPHHQPKFERLVSQVKSLNEAQFGVQYNITFSQQKNSTDTIAVDVNNEPFREDDGKPLFRPAGHGALLENLNELDADVIFIKNIDNVVPDRLKEDTITYKKALAGLLLSCQEEVFELVNGVIDDPMAVADRLKKAYSITMKGGFDKLSADEQIEYIKQRLDKPIRVCGMVKNTGEPGGGPFWVAAKDGSASLQIAETAQIDLSDQEKVDLLKNSTHFNPVDLICATKNSRGKKFDLLAYRDDDTGFISEKSKSGRDLKAMELPGLWNGAMADWITLFVEVPISTFNPVKTVNDLLKETHQ